ncbi:MAG: lytic transglycosylase domain-containing protein [Proteobacteria bacterium]|nr:lytic transglycosylase domain-containing protein [Pseudomonadota bacterium]
MRSPSCNRAAPAEHARRRPSPLAAAALAASLALLAAPPTRADRQEDPGLRAVVEEAIATTRCDGHDDRFGEEVFFKLQEPRLRRIVSDPGQRVEILRHVYCESHAVVARYRERDRFELHLTPELVLAVIDVESRFDRYAVSRAGAVGLMQVMPFWPRRLGVDNRLFGSVDFNIRLGCEILGYYMRAERNDYRRALARYNGSTGRREYPDLVLTRLSSRWRG